MISRIKKISKIRLTMLALVFSMLLVTMLLGTSYAKWSAQKEQKTPNKITTGCFSLNYDDSNSKSINLNNSYPMSESEALKNKPYEFSISNTCSYDMYYNITLNTPNESYLDNAIDFKIMDENDNEINSGILSSQKKYTKYSNNVYSDENGDSYEIGNSYILTVGYLKNNSDNSNTVKKYKLYLWIDENIEDPGTMGKTFNGKILVSSSNDRKALEIEEIQVEFDPNGGEVDNTQKNVLYKTEYGNLPIPKKEGSEFVGWNGKNKFNKDNVENNKKIVDGIVIDQENYFVSGNIIVEYPKKYFISGIGDIAEVYGYDQYNNLIYTNTLNNNSSFDTIENISYIKIVGLMSDLSSIQLEEGMSSSSYENYIINEKSIVEQNSNHTLKAIWK